MQSASSRIWTHVAVSISYNDNHYTTGTSCQGFIMTMVIVISFAHKHKTAPNDYAPEPLYWIVQSPTKLNDKI